MFYWFHEEQTRGVTSVWRLVILCVNNTLVPARTRILSKIVLNFQQTFRLFSVSFLRRHQRMRATGDLQQRTVYKYAGKFYMLLSTGLRFSFRRKTLHRYRTSVYLRHLIQTYYIYICGRCFFNLFLDHNECEKNGMCANGKCLNVQGSFQCRCKSGFVMSQTGHSCIGNVS